MELYGFACQKMSRKANGFACIVDRKQGFLVGGANSKMSVGTEKILR